jgi:hypothetical protein
VSTPPPSSWLDRLLGLALTVLAIAVALYIAAKLILAIWPVLIVAGVIVLIGLVGWSVYQLRKSRW